jgi:YbgC/YbaW family acyl-CoA thioester hydrolase
VQFYETDAAGIVHFSWFFRYMEEAEHALWRHAGLTIFSADEKVSWPRVSASFDFRRPLRFEEEFDVAIQVAAITNRSIRYTCVVTRGEEEIGSGTLTIACVRKAPDRSMEAVAIPPEIAARFQVASGEA